ncbi:uncharacterized protein LOC143823421 [Paroedura picta]|uniref:uncharacterized protein LOC143823421 n=1 Tax=Paroedura picta TaxID=143630 RepID=UPI004056EEB1
MNRDPPLHLHFPDPVGRARWIPHHSPPLPRAPGEDQLEHQRGGDLVTLDLLAVIPRQEETIFPQTPLVSETQLPDTPACPLVSTCIGGDRDSDSGASTNLGRTGKGAQEAAFPSGDRDSSIGTFRGGVHRGRACQPTVQGPSCTGA